MKTVIINIDKDSSLKKVLEFVKKLRLKAKVVDDKTAAHERDELLVFSSQNLGKAYGNDEPDYDLSMVKEPN